MTRFVAYLVRFAVILFGYIVASLAASAFLNILFLASVFVVPDDAHKMPVAALYFSIPFIALFVAYFAFIPAIIIILISEILSRRDWLFYALSGGIVAGVFLGFVHENPDFDFNIIQPRAIAAIVGSGMVGGIFYWFAAGRWAGNWWRATASAEPSKS